MKTSTFTFFTVLFEHLFLFLLGVFVGGGCTLFYAVYIVDQTVRNCERKMEAAPHNGSSPFLSAEVDHQTSCYTAFTTFIAVFGFVALLYALFKSYRYYQQNCPKAPEITTTTSEGETEKGGGNLGDTEAVSAIKMTTTSPSEGGKNNHHNNLSFLLTPRQASALLPSSLEHSKSTTSIRTDPSLKGVNTPDHLK